jgi:ribosomal protein L34E
VGGVLAGDAAEAGKPWGPNLLQPDKTNASDGVATAELGAEWRQKALHNLLAHPEVDERSASNQAADYWKTPGGRQVRHIAHINGSMAVALSESEAAVNSCKLARPETLQNSSVVAKRNCWSGLPSRAREGPLDQTSK